MILTHGSDTVAVDLRTGKHRAPRREDYFTKHTNAAPGGKCPQWEKFLDEVTAGKKELQAYLQRVAGYNLTGSVREHVVFFYYGTGANGKGVFINTLRWIWGGYATVAPMELFLWSPHDRHPTEKAGLRGARMVVSQEIAKGRRWDEAKLKELSGGDPISARYMRQDFFEFMPQFKLNIVANNKPSFYGVDEAIRRRIHLIPFTVTIPEKQRDPDLTDKLRAEWGGILQWAIDGARAYYYMRLAPPTVVTEATANYLIEEDSFGRWVEECCVTSPKYFGNGDMLWKSWKEWAERNNEPVSSRKAFAQTMEQHGYVSDKQAHMRGYLGIDLEQHGAADDNVPL
jgi:P4 family phage/plasmid primase-like protien